MSQIELEILTWLGKAGASMAHEIRIRELIQIHFCNGNQAMVNPRTPGGFGRTPTPGGGLISTPPYDLENYAG